MMRPAYLRTASTRPDFGICTADSPACPSLATNTHPLDVRSLSSVKLHETVPAMAIPTRMGMVRGMIWGGLIGLNPVLGMVAGRRSWSRRGALPQGAGLRNAIPSLRDSAKSQPGTSALFILFRKASWEKVLDPVAQFGGNADAQLPQPGGQGEAASCSCRWR